MPLQAMRGRIVDLRRYTNAHLYWRRPPGATERHELWLRQRDGHERKFTIHTRTLPARCGHEVSVIVKRRGNTPQVLGLFNVTTRDAVNYVRTDPPALFRAGDFVALPVAFVAMATGFGDAGMVLFAPVAVACLLTVSVSRAITRTLRAKRVDRAIAREVVSVGRRNASR